MPVRSLLLLLWLRARIIQKAKSAEPNAELLNCVQQLYLSVVPLIEVISQEQVNLKATKVDAHELVS